MAATALIQFTQGANTDAAGKAVLGAFGDLSDVTVTNGDNTDVASWTIYLLDAPADSVAFPPGDQPQILAAASDDTPIVDFTPDAAGTYRVMLEVVDGLGSIDRDIRCFGIPDGRGFVRPPYQQFPEPLPVELPVMITRDPRPTKPDEQNYGDNVRGWAGNGDSKQLDAFLREHADLPHRTVTATPFTASLQDPPLHLVDVTTISAPAVFNLPPSARVGFVSRVAVQGTGFPVSIVPPGGGTVDGKSDIRITAGGVFLVHRGSNRWETLTVAINAPTAIEDAGKIARVNADGDNVDYDTIEQIMLDNPRAQRARGTYHVEDFGAVARPFFDPVAASDAERTANVIAINACLEAARIHLGEAQFGGTVYLGPGVYYTNAAVGYDLDEDTILGVTVQGLGPFPVMISSNNATVEVFKLYTSSFNVRMFYMKDIAFHGGRTGLSLVRACYNRFENVWLWGSHQFALQSFLGSGNVFSKCFTTDTSQFGGGAMMFVSCADILENCTFGESSGPVFVLGGGLQIEGGYGYGIYHNGATLTHYTDYWTTPGSPVNVSLAFFAGETAAFFGSSADLLFSGLRLVCAKEFLALSDCDTVVLSGCKIEGGDITIGPGSLFTGFINIIQNPAGRTGLSINGGSFRLNDGASGFFIKERNGAHTQKSVIHTQLVAAAGSSFTALSSSAPALLNPGSEDNLVVTKTLSR